MIKARATLADDRPLFVIGLSAMNFTKLREGKPIVFNLESMGGVGEVLIMFGETETEIAAELADFIGPQTTVSGLKDERH